MTRAFCITTVRCACGDDYLPVRLGQCWCVTCIRERSERGRIAERLALIREAGRPAQPREDHHAAP